MGEFLTACSQVGSFPRAQCSLIVTGSGLGVCPYFMTLPSGRWGCWLPTEWGIGKNGQSVADSLEEMGGARADRHAYEASRGFLKRSRRKSSWSTRIDTENQGKSCKYRASSCPLAPGAAGAKLACGKSKEGSRREKATFGMRAPPLPFQRNWDKPGDPRGCASWFCHFGC